MMGARNLVVTSPKGTSFAQWPQSLLILVVSLLTLPCCYNLYQPPVLICTQMQPFQAVLADNAPLSSLSPTCGSTFVIAAGASGSHIRRCRAVYCDDLCLCHHVVSLVSPAGPGAADEVTSGT